MSTIEVCTATDVSEERLARFYERMYPERAAFLTEHWRWLYRVGTFDSVCAPILAVAGDEVVAQAGLIPVTVRRGDRDHTAIWFVDFWVLPEYQRKGLGTLLTERWMSSCPLHITFCNDRSAGVFRKLGWDISFHTMSFKLPLRPARHASAVRVLAKTAARVGGAVSRLVNHARTVRSPALHAVQPDSRTLARFDRVSANRALHVPRSADFLQWRVARHPRQGEYLVLTDSNATGWEHSALVRIVDDDGFRRLHLLSLADVALSPAALSRFFGAIVRWSLREEIDHVWFVTSDPEVAKVARWWFPVWSRTRFACHANHPEGAAFLGGTKHMWETLDSDLDLTY